MRRLTSAAHETSSCERTRAELQAAWTAAWRPAGLTPATPREMAAWLARVVGIVRDAQSSRELETSCRRMADDLEGVQKQLAAALAGHGTLVSPQATLGILVRQGEAAGASADPGRDPAPGLLDRLVEQRVLVVEAQRQCDVCAQALDAWQLSWAKLMERLGAKPAPPRPGWRKP